MPQIEVYKTISPSGIDYYVLRKFNTNDFQFIDSTRYTLADSKLIAWKNKRLDFFSTWAHDVINDIETGKMQLLYTIDDKDLYNVKNPTPDDSDKIRCTCPDENFSLLRGRYVGCTCGAFKREMDKKS